MLCARALTPLFLDGNGAGNLRNRVGRRLDVLAMACDQTAASWLHWPRRLEGRPRSLYQRPHLGVRLQNDVRLHGRHFMAQHKFCRRRYAVERALGLPHLRRLGCEFFTIIIQ